jgi:dUTP pyrophosphatase
MNVKEEFVDINIKKLHPDAVVPKYAKSGDAGMDLVAISKEESVKYDTIRTIITYGTGLAIEIPEGYVGLIFPRSSIYKTSQALSNSVGVIDSGYRGEIKFKIRCMMHQGDEPFVEYKVGDRIGQLIIMPYPKITFNVVDELSETDRGSGAFGSSGE